MKYLDQALSTETNLQSSGWQKDGSRESEKWSELLKPYLWKYLRAGLFMCAAYYLMQFVFGNSMGDMNKFDIKMAKSIEQRLDDVKGIDEIKDEVMNIIRIIKNP